MNLDSDYCFDGLRNFNQVRLACSTAASAFNDSLPAPISSRRSHRPATSTSEEDKNVDFGDE